jgi:hypothetical protein
VIEPECVLDVDGALVLDTRAAIARYGKTILQRL